MGSSLLMVLAITMRWVHVVSVATILGGFLVLRFGFYPAVASLPSPAREQAGPAVAARFRGLLYTVVGAALLSGIYNYLTKASYPPGYHMWIGIKILLALHIFASAILYGLPRTEESKRPRLATNIIVSGLVIVLISGWLRWLTLHAVAAGGGR
jgi:uncharacterized membrane protein